jgi:hypothetical protein
MKVQYIIVEIPIIMEETDIPIEPSNEKALREWVMIAANGGGFKILSSDRVEDAHVGRYEI